MFFQDIFQNKQNDDMPRHEALRRYCCA